ncbi:NPH3 domain [Sesbania bispinosa]|nr:NPH3 domain [Sesbania bispinosa]
MAQAADKSEAPCSEVEVEFPLLPKCGLLQRLCYDSSDSESVSLELHDIPGGEDAFELCAKFCYGISINISAHNFVSALCWKDSIATLQTTATLPEWSENLGIVRKVKWSYTYTRPGYTKKQHHSVPKDWWTEDVSDLDIDLFSWLLVRLLSISIHLGVSSVTKTELIRRASLQFEEATVSDLLYPSTSSSDQNYYDIELVLAVLETFLKLWKRMSPGAVDNSYFLRSIRNVGKLIDSYLQVVARDDNMQVPKFVSLAETVPSIAREYHDDLYQAIDIYLKVK